MPAGRESHTAASAGARRGRAVCVDATDRIRPTTYTPMRLATCACDVNHANPQSTTWSVHDAVAHRRFRPQAAAAAAEAQRLEAEENAEKLAAAQAELEAAKHALPERASAAAAGDIAWTTCNTDHAGRTAQRTTDDANHAPTQQTSTPRPNAHHTARTTPLRTCRARRTTECCVRREPP